MLLAQQTKILLNMFLAPVANKYYDNSLYNICRPILKKMI